MVLDRQQRADVAVQHEVRLVGALDGLGDLRVGGVDQVAHVAADGLLPARQGVDVSVNARVGGLGHVFPVFFHRVVAEEHVHLKWLFTERRIEEPSAAAGLATDEDGRDRGRVPAAVSGFLWPAPLPGGCRCRYAPSCLAVERRHPAAGHETRCRRRLPP